MVAAGRSTTTFGNRIVSFLFSGVDQYLSHEQRREARGWPLERLIVECNKAFTTSSRTEKIKILLVELIRRPSVDPRERETIQRLFFPASQLLENSSEDRSLRRLVVILLKDLLDTPHHDENSTLALYNELAKSWEKRPELSVMLMNIVPSTCGDNATASNTYDASDESILKAIQSVLCDEKRIGDREVLTTLVALHRVRPRTSLLQPVMDCIQRHAYTKQYPMIVCHGISVILSCCAAKQIPFSFWESIFPHLQYTPLAQVQLVRHAVQCGHERFLAFVIRQSQLINQQPQDPMVTMEAIIAVLEQSTRYNSATLGPVYTTLEHWAVPPSSSRLLCSLAIRTLAKYASLRHSVVFVETVAETAPAKAELRPTLGDSWMEPVDDNHSLF